MSIAPAPTTAFSLAQPLSDARRALAVRPLRAGVVFLVTALPIVALLAGAVWALQSGAAATLERLVIGVSAGTPGALLIEPSAEAAAGDVATLAALGAATLALLFAAGAAAAHGRGGLAAWPVYALGFLVHACVLALAVAALFGLATLAGRLQFVLYDVALVVGAVPLVWVLARVAVWPVLAAQERIGPLAAARASWQLTRGHALRVAFAAGTLGVALAVPAALLTLALRAGLTALERGEQITWSPLTIDIVALVPWLLALVAGVVLWSLATHAIAGALRNAAERGAGAGA